MKYGIQHFLNKFQKERVQFDRSGLEVQPLCKRRSDLTMENILPLKPAKGVCDRMNAVADRIVNAKRAGSSVILMMGAHVLRSGVQRYLIDMMEKGYISCIAMNGAGVIHDFEFAMIGETTESVSHYIKKGHFGLWTETGRINDIVTEAAEKKSGLGEAVGNIIETESFPGKDISILAAGYRLGIPVTIHVGIGYDIVHELPNCNGAAYGDTSYRDFLTFAGVMSTLEGGVVMNFGSAVMAPEVYLKALSMVRNVARQKGRTISQFTTLVCDLADLPENYHVEPSKSSPAYYFRPWKTMLVRTVADGGTSYYVQGYHKDTVPALWSAINNFSSYRVQESKKGECYVC